MLANRLITTGAMVNISFIEWSSRPVWQLLWHELKRGKLLDATTLRSTVVAEPVDRLCRLQPSQRASLVDVDTYRKDWRQTRETKEFCDSRQNIGSHPSRTCHFAQILIEEGVSATPAKSILQKMVEYCQEVPTTSRRNPFCERAREERSLLGIVQRGGQNSRSPNALSHTQLGSCADFIEANMEFVRKIAWDLLKNVHEV